MSLRSATFQQVREVIEQCALAHGMSGQIGEDDPLLDKGMTSMALVDVMLGVEGKFDFLFPNKELNPINFSSMKSIAEAILRILGNSIEGALPVLSEATSEGKPLD